MRGDRAQRGRGECRPRVLVSGQDWEGGTCSGVCPSFSPISSLRVLLLPASPMLVGLVGVSVPSFLWAQVTGVGWHLAVQVHPGSPLWLEVTQVTLVLQASHVQLLQNPPAGHKALVLPVEMDTAPLSAALPSQCWGTGWDPSGNPQFPLCDHDLLHMGGGLPLAPPHGTLPPLHWTLWAQSSLSHPCHCSLRCWPAGTCSAGPLLKNVFIFAGSPTPRL